MRPRTRLAVSGVRPQRLEDLQDQPRVDRLDRQIVDRLRRGGEPETAPPRLVEDAEPLAGVLRVFPACAGRLDVFIRALLEGDRLGRIDLSLAALGVAGLGGRD